MKIPRLYRYIPIFRAPASRVLLEIFIVQTIFTLVYPLIFGTTLRDTHSPEALLRANQQATLMTIALYYFLFFTISILWAVMRWRLRPVQRPRWLQCLYEIAMSIIFCLELIVCQAILSAVLHYIPPFGFLLFLPATIDTHLADLNAVTLFILPFFCTWAFFFLRLGVYILRFWNRLRKTHIVWALTNAHLTVLFIGAVAVYILIIPIFIIQDIGQSRPLYSMLGLPLAALGVIIVLLAIGIATVLPPSALFSYLFSRHLVRRIENLVQGAGALRAGNYSVRVPVEGMDEIARLQTDFNAMATDLERTMRELKEERDNVGTLLNNRRELIASVSHELRTPVATIRSYLESALMSWQEQPPETLRQDLQVMEQQMIRLQSLINDLFTLSRAEVGHLEMRCQPTNVASLVKRVAETIGPVAWHGSRIEVIADIETPDAEFLLALVDGNRLEQVLQNLLHNGIRHTPPGGIIIVSAHAEAEMIVLQVKDTGEGIAPKELAHIWERFYRTENTHNKVGGGSGLGLAIVKELTEAMGGSVAVSSVIGEGTCFTIGVPRVDVGSGEAMRLGIETKV